MSQPRQPRTLVLIFNADAQGSRFDVEVSPSPLHCSGKVTTSYKAWNQFWRSSTQQRATDPNRLWGDDRRTDPSVDPVRRQQPTGRRQQARRKRKIPALQPNQQHDGCTYSTDQHLRELNSDDFHAVNPRIRFEPGPDRCGIVKTTSDGRYPLHPNRPVRRSGIRQDLTARKPEMRLLTYVILRVGWSHYKALCNGPLRLRLYCRPRSVNAWRCQCRVTVYPAVGRVHSTRYGSRGKHEPALSTPFYRQYRI